MPPPTPYYSIVTSYVMMVVAMRIDSRPTRARVASLKRNPEMIPSVGGVPSFHSLHWSFCLGKNWEKEKRSGTGTNKRE